MDENIRNNRKQLVQKNYLQISLGSISWSASPKIPPYKAEKTVN